MRKLFLALLGIVTSATGSIALANGPRHNWHHGQQWQQQQSTVQVYTWSSQSPYSTYHVPPIYSVAPQMYIVPAPQLVCDYYRDVWRHGRLVRRGYNCRLQ